MKQGVDEGKGREREAGRWKVAHSSQPNLLSSSVARAVRRESAPAHSQRNPTGAWTRPSRVARHYTSLPLVQISNKIGNVTPSAVPSSALSNQRRQCPRVPLMCRVRHRVQRRGPGNCHTLSWANFQNGKHLIQKALMKKLFEMESCQAQSGQRLDGEKITTVGE